LYSEENWAVEENPIAYIAATPFGVHPLASLYAVESFELSPTAIKKLQSAWMCAQSARFFISKAVTLSIIRQLCNIILLHLRWRWRLGRENFIESCVIWLMTQPLEFCFVLYDLTGFFCVCCAVFMTK